MLLKNNLLVQTQRNAKHNVTRRCSVEHVFLTNNLLTCNTKYQRGIATAEGWQIGHHTRRLDTANYNIT